VHKETGHTPGGMKCPAAALIQFEERRVDEGWEARTGRRDRGAPSLLQDGPTYQSHCIDEEEAMRIRPSP